MSSYTQYLGARRCCDLRVQGAQGPQGSQGAAAVGPVGYQGYTGAQGYQGATGRGCVGATGAQGPAGIPGPAGGAQGATGATGAVGATGPIFLTVGYGPTGNITGAIASYPNINTIIFDFGDHRHDEQMKTTTIDIIVDNARK